MNDTDSNLAVDNAVTMSDLFKGRTVALFGVPAPFTGTCTMAHYPPYQKLQDEFLAKGVDVAAGAGPATRTPPPPPPPPPPAPRPPPNGLGQREERETQRCTK